MTLMQGEMIAEKTEAETCTVEETKSEDEIEDTPQSELLIDLWFTDEEYYGNCEAIWEKLQINRELR